MITSTGALSETILLASGYNAADALVTGVVLALGLILFCCFSWLFAYGYPVR